MIMRGILLGLALGVAAATPALAQPRQYPDQDAARRAMRAGEIRSLRDIQRRWRDDMPGYDFLGSDYDPSTGNYRLKFMRNGSVSWVDVDGRTGREIGRSPH